MPRRVDVYFSLLSPWAHLGHAPFTELVAKHGLEVAWKPVQLGALFAETGGLPLGKRAVQRQRYRFVELQRWAAKRGRPLVLRPKHWPFEPDLADGCVLSLLEQGEDPAGFIGAALRAVWEEERDLTDRATLAELLAAAGHDAARTLAGAETPSTAAAYEANRAAAASGSVFGSPAYVLDGEVFWGQDRLDLLDEALETGRPPYTADF
ncbi:2-hydroxychromene-2-carboxylate isomerase [Methylopila turkensis]|uniref:2-hydroxychromene-2-carboxylate isomerase n=1 Tax=Methylopila turkensis TaxID=1437816 RepID=A0A9W6JR25_9HYPH|nr:2-hydroxychromene-2-carboxylate isomerase [Methylopila turkensis]GLK81727.1 2-hydroxychromene-2-carboxylate isomerase [Methylopila turkensis]